MSDFEDFLNELYAAVAETPQRMHPNMNGPEHFRAANELLYDAETRYNAAREAGEITTFKEAITINLELIKAHSLQAQTFAALESARVTVEVSDKAKRAHEARVITATYKSVVAILSDMQDEPAKVLGYMLDDPKIYRMIHSNDGSTFQTMHALIRGTLEYLKLNISEAGEVLSKLHRLTKSDDGPIVDYVEVTPDMSAEDVSQEVQEKVKRLRGEDNPHPHATVDDARNIVDAMFNPSSSDLIEDDENESRDF